MRDYLISFFKEFEYDKIDEQYLLKTYDKIIHNELTSKILYDALSDYESNIKLDFEEQIINRAKTIAKAIDVHPYTTELLVFMCLTKHLREVYIDKGLDMQIFHNSILDLKWKIEECKVVEGICGSFVANWFCGFFTLERFALGRLQFEIISSPIDYDKNGVKLEKNITKVINVHIPRTGTPIDKDSCDDSYRQAKEFYKDLVGEKTVFICDSWLLYPGNFEILPEYTNTYRFMSEYDIVDSNVNYGESLWRLFDTDEKNPDRLPQNGTLRRCYVEHLKKGGRVGWGLGVKIL